MAIYIPGVKDYVPQLEVFTPDYKFLSDVLETRQDRYTTNYEQLNNIYGKVVYSDLSREDNQNRRDQYAQLLAPRLEQISGLDLSLQQNVDAAKSLFKPFWDDENIVYDMLWTKKYNEQMQHAQQLENSTDSVQRERYWSGGVEALNFQMEDFVAASQEEARNMSAPKYVPDPDLYETAFELLKESGMSLEDFTFENGFIIKQKNGSLLTKQPYGYDKDGNIKYGNPARDYVQEALQDDPMVKNYYATKAYVEMRRWVKENEQQHGGVNGAKEAWANQKLSEYNISQGNKISKTDDLMNKAAVSAGNWEEYKKTYGIIPKSKQEEEYFKAISRLDNAQATKKMQLNKMNHITSQSGNLDTKLMKAYQAIMAQDIGGALERASVKYSMIDASRTVEINPYEKMSTQHAYDMDKMRQKQNYDKELVRLRAEADAWKESMKGGNTSSTRSGGGGSGFGGQGGTGAYIPIELPGSVITNATDIWGNPDNEEPTTYDFNARNQEDLAAATDKINAVEIDFVQRYVASTSADPSVIKYTIGEGANAQTKTASPDEFAKDMRANPDALTKIYSEYEAELKKVEDLAGNDPKLLEPQFNKQYNTLSTLRKEAENRKNGWESAYDESSGWLKTSFDEEMLVDASFNETLGAYGAPSIITNDYIKARITEGEEPAEARKTANYLIDQESKTYTPEQVLKEEQMFNIPYDENPITGFNSPEQKAYYEKRAKYLNIQSKKDWNKLKTDLKYYILPKEDYVKLYVEAARLPKGTKEKFDAARGIVETPLTNIETGRDDYYHRELMMPGESFTDKIQNDDWGKYAPDWSGDRNIHGDTYEHETTIQSVPGQLDSYEKVDIGWKFNEEAAIEMAEKSYEEQYQRYMNRWNGVTAGTPGGPETFTVHQHLTGEEQTGAGVAMYKGYQTHYDHFEDFNTGSKANYQLSKLKEIMRGNPANFIVGVGFKDLSTIPTETNPQGHQAVLQLIDHTEKKIEGSKGDKTGYAQFSQSYHQALGGLGSTYTKADKTQGNYRAYVLRPDNAYAKQWKATAAGTHNNIFDEGDFTDNTLVVYVKEEVDNNVMSTENQQFSNVGNAIRMEGSYKNNVPKGGRYHIWENGGQYWVQVWTSKFNGTGYSDVVTVPAQPLGYQGADGSTTLLTWGELDSYATDIDAKLFKYKGVQENLQNNAKAELGITP